MNKKLQQARREYDKNLQARKLMLHNLGIELGQPVHHLSQLVRTLQDTTDLQQQHDIKTKLVEQSATILELIDNITLLTKLETQDWQTEQQVFSLSTLIDNLLLDLLPRLIGKA